MNVERHEFESSQPGTHLVILGGIHGNETCGPNALRKIISEFQSGQRRLLRGRCTIFPIANPRAYNAGTRYIEENLNRVFEVHSNPSSYERHLATEIAPWVSQADALLDIHSMQSQGDPFVFLNAPTPESQELCEALGTAWILQGWPNVYASMPELLACCTQTFADRYKIPNALVECGSHADPAADGVAYRAILGALTLYEMIKEGDAPSARDSRHLRMTDLHLRLSEKDHFPKVWKNFEAFQKGEVLATRASGEEIRAERNGIMILPSPVSALGAEWFYTGHLLES
jgi:succinylglutamate desuccinylase